MLSAKRDRIEHKLSRVTALNDAIKSFSIGFNKERREVFSDAMSRLNGATADCLSDKKDNLISQKNELLAKYNDPKTFIGDKLNLQGKINDVYERISALENRITKLSRPETYYAEQTNDQLDASMKLTADKISEMTDSGNLSVPVLAEGVIDSAHKIEGMELSEVAAVADSLRDMPLKNTEIQIEDDLNMIDGIINNGSKSDLNQAREELLDGIKSMQELAGKHKLFLDTLVTCTKSLDFGVCKSLLIYVLALSRRSFARHNLRNKFLLIFQSLITVRIKCTFSNITVNLNILVFITLANDSSCALR